MKIKNIVLTVLTSLAISANAQTNPTTFIKGNLDIKFSTRTQKGVKGVTDVYKLDVNISDSAKFIGTVTHTPTIIGGLISSVQQQASLNYNLDCFVLNPKNPTQSKNVGRMYGVVPIDENNVYKFSDGNLQTSILQVGMARGFDSKTTGLALGKPPVKVAGILDRIKEDLKFSKQVNGKTVTISVSKYDKMEFQNHTLAAGPVQIYPEVTVNGSLIYDYARTAWYFKNVNVSYVVDGRPMVDKLSGNIRWVDAKGSIEGQYEYDIRVNEPLPSESAVFSNSNNDESSFFEIDTTIPSLTGTMKYKDITSNNTVTSSAVMIDLNGNKLTKQQTMWLCKLIILSSIVPFNAE